MAVQATVEAIFRAAMKGDAGDVARRLNLEPDLLESRTPSYSGSLVFEAAFSGHADVMRVLIGKGADVNATGQCGTTPIDAAVLAGHREVVDLLLEAGAELTQMGYTTLMTAFDFRRWSTMRRLLQHMSREGLNVRGPNGGSTVLMLACIYRQVEVTRALLVAGADDTIADDRGITPRQVAQRSRFHPCRAVFQVGALNIMIIMYTANPGRPRVST
jgi:ankyrin repeat protein